MDSKMLLNVFHIDSIRLKSFRTSVLMEQETETDFDFSVFCIIIKMK